MDKVLVEALKVAKQLLGAGVSSLFAR